ncbi:hypothetical protein DFH11DRAFT_1615018 [Phellopilus nigrolimitatus]|nr:hypothetical protein DFH11DRAFT_1615018 [Phellopilus nigrolimitatus]
MRFFTTYPSPSDSMDHAFLPGAKGKYSFIPLALSPSKGKALQKSKKGTRRQRSKEGPVASGSTLAEPSSPDVPLDEIHSFDGLNASTISTSPVAGPSYIPSIGRNDDFNIAADHSCGSDLDLDLEFAGEELRRKLSPPLPALSSPSWKGVLLPGILDAKVFASDSVSEHASTVSHDSGQSNNYSTPPSSCGSPSPSTSSQYRPPLPTGKNLPGATESHGEHLHQLATVQPSALHPTGRSEAVATQRQNLKRKAEEEAPRTNCTDPTKMVCLYKGCQVELTRDKDVIRRHLKTHKPDFEESLKSVEYSCPHCVHTEAGDKRSHVSSVKKYDSWESFVRHILDDYGLNAARCNECGRETKRNGPRHKRDSCVICMQCRMRFDSGSKRKEHQRASGHRQTYT